MRMNLRDLTMLSSALSVAVIVSLTDVSLAQDSLGNLQADARDGDPEAQFVLGEKYVKGDGVPKNLDQGVKWLTAAANQRHGQAQLSLGILYFYGWGVPANPATAKHWLERAARNGVNEASYYLGKPELRSVTGAPSKTTQRTATTQSVPQATPQPETTRPAPRVAGRPSVQTPPTQPQTGTRRRSNAYDLRGIQLGMTLAEFRAHPFPDRNPKHPAKVFCTGDQTPKDSYIHEDVYGEDKAIGLIKCDYYEFKPYVKGIRPSWQKANLGVANVSAFMEYSFIPDPGFSNTPRLFKIRAYYNVEAWEKFWAGYTGKYGQPDEIDKSPTQNKMGAIFDNVVAVWRNEESSISLYKRFGKISVSYIFYLHTELAAHVGKLREKVTGKPSDNL